MISNRIAVVGAGITGLTAAYKIQKAGYHVDVYEAKEETGGAIKTVQNSGWTVEYGPNTILLKEKIVNEFLRELGLTESILPANSQAENRFIIKNSELEPLPDSLISAVKTPLFTLKGKARVLVEPFIKTSSNRDQSIADFVERRLGSEILEYAINPFVAGIFANNPENLSLRHAFPLMDKMEQNFGSLIWASVAGSKERKDKGRIPRQLISFEDGLQQLPQTISNKLQNIHFGRSIQRIQKTDGQWIVQGQNKKFGPYKKIILNIPLYKWHKNLLPITDDQLETLSEVSYPPISVLHLGYKKSDIIHPLNGFGFLVPQKEDRKILGALFPSTLFPGRAPDDYHLLTVFIGGGRQPKLAKLDGKEILELAESELNDLIGLRGKTQFKEHVYWPDSIPAYHIGYDTILQTIDTIENQHPGLILAGNYRNGISVPDCIKNGLKLAEDITA